MIAAVVLAAGQSKRMGYPKLILPWGETTVIGKVIDTLWRGGFDEIVVVTGGASRQVKAAIDGLGVRAVHNPTYAEFGMLGSFQIGLRSLNEEIDAALVTLGDQPQIEVEIVKDVLSAYRATQARIVVPSYSMRRGHPWLIARSIWSAVFKMQELATLRHLLDEYNEEIFYLLVETSAVVRDLDTPEDYLEHESSFLG